MSVQRAIAAVLLFACVLTAVPAVRVAANGAASTRNIILGIGAATYLILQHNRKVHQRYAEDAQRQAALEQQRNDLNAAYTAERRAYEEEVAVNATLRREISYQHQVVTQQRHELTSLNVHDNFVAANDARTRSGTQPVALVSYGWGDL